MRSMSNTSIREILNEKLKERGYTLSQLARELGKDPRYLQSIFKGKTTSRPTVYRIAKLLQFPELCYLYEEFLHEKKYGSQKEVSQSKKAPSLDKEKEVEKDGQKA